MGCWPGFRRPFLVHTGGAPLFASRNAWNNSLTLRSAPHRCFVVSSANGGVSSRSLCRSWCRLRQTTKSCHGACSRGAERDRLASNVNSRSNFRVAFGRPVRILTRHRAVRTRYSFQSFQLQDTSRHSSLCAHGIWRPRFGARLRTSR